MSNAYAIITDIPAKIYEVIDVYEDASAAKELELDYDAESEAIRHGILAAFAKAKKVIAAQLRNAADNDGDIPSAKTIHSMVEAQAYVELMRRFEEEA